MAPFQETDTPFLTSFVRALSALAGLFVLLLLGADFTGNDEDEEAEDVTGSNLRHGLNYMNGELDGGLDPDGSYK